MIYLFFSEIKLEQCSLEEFPPKIFKGMHNIGLKFQETNVKYLNLFDLAAKNINYIVLENALVKVFGGHPPKSLTLAKSASSGDAKLVIRDSKIGYLGQNAFSFKDYKFQSHASIKIERSLIGVMETSSIKVGNNIFLEIIESTLSYIKPLAVSLGEETNLFMEKSFLGIGQDSITNLKCDTSIKIRDNIIYSRKILSACISNGVENLAFFPCNATLELSDYVDATCENNNTSQNILLSVSDPAEPIPITSTTTIRATKIPTTATFPTTTSPTTVTTPCIFLETEIPENATSRKNISQPENEFGSWSKLIDKKLISVKLFYILVGFCLVLFLTTVILTSCLIFTKNCQKKQEENSSGRENKYEVQENVLNDTDFTPISPI